MKQGTAALNGTTLYYEAYGDGPPIVLIGGGGMLDRRMWDGQVQALASRHMVVRYDVRGIGKSARPDGPFSHSADLDALSAFLDLGPAWIVGLSFSAGIAIDVALDLQERVKGLIVASPGLSSDKARNLKDALAVADLARTSGLGSMIDLIVNSPTVLAAANPEAQQWVRTMYQENADVFARDFELVRLSQPTDPPADGRLGSIRAPTLILVGDRDAVATRDTADTLAARIAGSTTIVVPGAGHFLNLDAPDAFNSAVLAFTAPVR